MQDAAGHKGAQPLAEVKQQAQEVLDALNSSESMTLPKRPRFLAAVAREALGELLSTLTTGEEKKAAADLDAAVEAIYEAYPRKADAGHAKKSIRAAVKKLTARWRGDELASALWLWQRVREYADSPKVRGGVKDGENFIPYCGTWMNGERYDDPAVEWGWKPRELAARKFRALPAGEQARLRAIVRERYPNTTDTDGSLYSVMRMEGLQ